RKESATVDVSHPSLGIDRQPAHAGQVDDDAAVAGAESRHAVPTAADRHDQVLLSGEANGGDDIVNTGAASDESGTLVRHGVPDDARGVVLGVVRPDDLAGEVLESRRRHRLLALADSESG